jgi:hypothetical protein
VLNLHEQQLLQHAVVRTSSSMRYLSYDRYICTTTITDTSRTQLTEALKHGCRVNSSRSMSPTYVLVYMH